MNKDLDLDALEKLPQNIHIKKMSELERVDHNLKAIEKSLNENGAQNAATSLEIIAQALIECAYELALLNDNMKGNQEDEQC